MLGKECDDCSEVICAAGKYLEDCGHHSKGECESLFISHANTDVDAVGETEKETEKASLRECLSLSQTQTSTQIDRDRETAHVTDRQGHTQTHT